MWLLLQNQESQYAILPRPFWIAYFFMVHIKWFILLKKIKLYETVTFSQTWKHEQLTKESGLQKQMEFLVEGRKKWGRWRVKSRKSVKAKFIRVELEMIHSLVQM
jgi:hypothetical protein